MADLNNDRRAINRKKESRTKEISRMISEGGLGAEKYYDIHKNSQQKDQNKNDN